MFSMYSINWAELTQKEKWICLGIFGIAVLIGLIDYLYKKHKEKDKMWQNLTFEIKMI